MRFIFTFLSIGFLFCGCKEAEAEADVVAVKMPAKVMYEEDPNYDMAVDSVATEAVQNAPAMSTSSEEKMEQKIIKSGDLRFETSDMEETYGAVNQLIKKHKAIVQSDTEDKDSYTFSRYLTLRIPNEHFDNFINDLGKGVDYFDRKNISIEDVTEEYIDVASRIKTKKALETRYLELLNKANKVSEMLEIERELATIREEIEAKEGRLKYIQNKVAMSTINIEFYKAMERKAGARVSFGTKFVNAIKSGFNGISTFFLWVIEVWPFIIILVALIYFIRKRFKKKSNNQNVDTN
ncbi:MAG: DUF4349 domain-containing protein [Flavobacteriales bacterium]|nr:DUF4349 domain-containing protein [Flavobacteriales bacterium]